MASHTEHAARLELVEADLEKDDGWDAAVEGVDAIHHLASPERFFHHAAAHLTDNGLLIVAELSAHQQQWVSDACGDVWLGFTADQLIEWSSAAGFTPLQQQHLAQRNGFNVQVHTFQLNSLI